MFPELFEKASGRKDRIRVPFADEKSEMLRRITAIYAGRDEAPAAP